MSTVNSNSSSIFLSCDSYIQAWQLLIGFAEDAHARHSSNKFDLCTHSTASFLTPGITLNITHFCPILFSGKPFLRFTACSPTAIEVSYPYRCWYLTHTPNGVSPIHPTGSHPYTQRGLTHTPNGVSPIGTVGIKQTLVWIVNLTRVCRERILKAISHRLSLLFRQNSG